MTKDIDEILNELNIEEKAVLLNRLLGPLMDNTMTHKEAAFYFCHIARAATYREIAKVFNCAIGLVSNTVGRARKKVRD